MRLNSFVIEFDHGFSIHPVTFAADTGRQQFQSFKRDFTRRFSDFNDLGYTRQVENLAHLGREMGYRERPLRFEHGLMHLEYAADAGTRHIRTVGKIEREIADAIEG